MLRFLYLYGTILQCWFPYWYQHPVSRCINLHITRLKLCAAKHVRLRKNPIRNICFNMLKEQSLDQLVGTKNLKSETKLNLDRKNNEASQKMTSNFNHWKWIHIRTSSHSCPWESNVTLMKSTDNNINIMFRI